MTNSVKVAAVQTPGYSGLEEKKNVPTMLSMLDKAADTGAEIICFPEGYPGPWVGLRDYSYPEEEIRKKARARGVYVIAGWGEPVEDYENALYTTQIMYGPDGSIVGKYRRTHQVPQSLWDDQTKPLGISSIAGFGTPANGTIIEPFKTKFCKVGVLLCSETWLPELSRILALKGAEIIFLPVGGTVESLWDGWKILIRARAIENLCYTVNCCRVYGFEKGVATITSPEGVLAESDKVGIITAELDLERIRWLRDHEERMVLPKPYAAIPGLLDWRRPELYKGLLDKFREPPAWTRPEIPQLRAKPKVVA